jgi:hypothetical protein
LSPYSVLKSPVSRDHMVPNVKHTVLENWALATLSHRTLRVKPEFLGQEGQ